MGESAAGAAVEGIDYGKSYAVTGLHRRRLACVSGDAGADGEESLQVCRFVKEILR